ncbi:hypothetical protein X798_01103 [Onchocerca flexuosa]|uniref:Uncharacterized protein n=1 Tax=Onchocerca flexuosa TaxID=387005 RepID=A0A238C375_9BILA|nr:hypothetical protein X798_01103 [Onchocerca flexuosa]
MAFYFALMNISRTTFDNSAKRRSLSVPHYQDHLQRSDRRRCTIISYSANGLHKQDELSSQTYQGQREFYKVEKNSKPRNDIQGKKVMFEKRESGKIVIKVNNFSKSHAFLDEDKNINTNCKEKDNALHAEHLVTTFHNENVKHNQRNVVKKSLRLVTKQKKIEFQARSKKISSRIISLFRQRKKSERPNRRTQYRIE